MALDLPAPPPVPATRDAIAAFVSRHVAPCSPRSVESWPLTYRRLNGRAVAEWADVLTLLRERYDRAPVYRGGKGRVPGKSLPAA
jgi:hypothetical protein